MKEYLLILQLQHRLAAMLHEGKITNPEVRAYLYRALDHIETARSLELNNCIHEDRLRAEPKGAA